MRIPMLDKPETDTKWKLGPHQIRRNSSEIKHGNVTESFLDNILYVKSLRKSSTNSNTVVFLAGYFLQVNVVQCILVVKLKQLLSYNTTHLSALNSHNHSLNHAERALRSV